MGKCKPCWERFICPTFAPIRLMRILNGTCSFSRSTSTLLKSKIKRSRSHSFSDIHDSFFRFKVGGNTNSSLSHLMPLQFRSESTDAKHAITKMLAVYPHDVLRKFITNKLLSPEELFYFKQKLASDLAYNSFTQSCFSTGKIIRNRLQQYQHQSGNREMHSVNHSSVGRSSL